MSPIVLSCFLALAGPVQACSADGPWDQEQPPEIMPQQEVLLTATTEQRPGTKTVLGEDDTSILWCPADEIKVFSGGSAAKFTSQNTSAQGTAEFLGYLSLNSGEGDWIYGLYPYSESASCSGGVITTTLPAAQTGLAGSFQDDLFPAIARSRTLDLGFQNICSGYRFSFREDGFESVTLKSNDGTPLAGTFSAAFDQSGNPAVTACSSPSASVTLQAPAGGFAADDWYYLVTLPGTHAGGYTFTATSPYESRTYRIDNAKTLTRSRFKQIQGLDDRLVPGTLTLQPVQDPDIVFSTSQNGCKKRIPAIAVTAGGAFLAATEHRPSTSDASLTGIYLARKTRDGAWSYDLVTLDYAQTGTWGKIMNPSFTIDAAGAHGPAGRIYLFFLATTAPSGLAMDSSVSQIASCYVYSDDDGITWSEINRIPEQAWEPHSYLWMVPAPANGIQTSDGTLLIPCMGRSNGHWYSAILFKKPGQDWAYSPATATTEDNESTCYVGPDGAVYLNCRNEGTTQERPLYRFDPDENTLTKVSNPFYPNLICQGTLCRASYDGTGFYLMSFPDPTGNNIRNRITVWASRDALHWTPVVRLTGTTRSAGYSAVDFRDGVCGVVWEHDSTTEKIGFLDLTPLLHLFKDYLPAE